MTRIFNNVLGVKSKVQYDIDEIDKDGWFKPI